MATLKQLVDETTNIKDELKTCHTNLKTNLISKGVQIDSSEKINEMINKIQDLKTYKKVAGTEKTYISDSNRYSTSSSTYDKMVEFVIDDNFESFRVSYSTNQTSYTCYQKLIHTRNGVELYSREDGKSTSVVQDLSDVRIGDKIEVHGKAGGANAAITSFKIKYSVEFV